MAWPKGKKRGSKAPATVKSTLGRLGLRPGIDDSATQSDSVGPGNVVDPEKLVGASGRVVEGKDEGKASTGKSRRAAADKEAVRPGIGHNNPPPEPLDTTGWGDALFSIHLMAATWTKASELALEPMEAEALATASGRVARHYAKFGKLFSEKTIDWCNLLMVAGGVYGTRMFAIKKRIEAEMALKRPPQVLRNPGQQMPQPAPPASPAPPAPPTEVKGPVSAPTKMNGKAPPEFTSFEDLQSAAAPLHDPRRFTPN